MLPWQLRSFDNKQIAELHAIYDVEKMIEAYHSIEHQKEIDSIRSDSGSKKIKGR